MRHYCTLFDSKYLPQGLVLYESLKEHSSEDFQLHVLAMDQATLDWLWSNWEDDVTVYHIRFIEQELSGIETLRTTRTWQEYCWTMASAFSWYLIERQELPEITYLDADMMFFSDPKVIFDEIGERSIGIIPHRFIPSKKYLETNGQFNVSWVSFKNTPVGRECLSRWAAQVRAKCSATDGCGDQKYLDEFPARYGAECHVIQNIGAGLVPWNLANYEFFLRDGVPIVVPAMFRLHANVQAYETVFYHYHEFRENPDGTFRLTNYDLRPEDRELIYEPYLEAYRAAKQRIAEIGTLASQ